MKTEILTSNQISFLDKVSSNDFLTANFYLTGGTALAGFYLGHRLSEDLDFFSEKEIDPLTIDVFLKQISQESGIIKIDFQQSYNRNLFFLHFNNDIIKTEFTFFPFPRIERGMKQHNLELDSILDIAVNKLFTIYQRCHARDYIDLYFLCQRKGYAIEDLISKAKIKFDWHIDLIQLGTQFTKAPEAIDYPRMIQEIDHKKWQEFFLEQAKKLKPKITK